MVTPLGYLGEEFAIFSMLYLMGQKPSVNPGGGTKQGGGTRPPKQCRAILKN